MFANIKVNIPSTDRQVERKRERERERERERDACVLFLISPDFFYSGNSTTYFKVWVDLCKKSDRTRCLAVSILEYNINWKGRTK